MKPGPASAVSVMGRYLALGDAPRSTLTILAAIVRGEGWNTSSQSADEVAENWLKRFNKRLQDELDVQNRAGRHVLFAFNSSDADLIQGAAFIEPSDSADVAESKRKRLGHQDYISALTALTPDEFESACRGILREMGVVHPSVTRRSADNGIDFYGRWELAPELRRAGALPSFYSTLHVWLIGQAKKYDATQVATPDIRELVGSIELARGDAFPNPNIAASLDVRVCDPVYYIFFTTGSISNEGWKLMAASGVVGMDGLMLADFLADHEVGRLSGGFDSAEFSAWVRR